MLVCASGVSSINNRWSSRIYVSLLYILHDLYSHVKLLLLLICKLILPKKKKNNVDSYINPNLYLCKTEHCGVSFVICFLSFFVFIENILRCSPLFDAHCKYVFTLYIFINLGASPCLYDELLVGNDIDISHQHLRFHLIYCINVSSHFDRNTISCFIILFAELIGCSFVQNTRKFAQNSVVSLKVELLIM